MATYEFGCTACGRFRARFAMSEVPPEAACPPCGGSAARLLSSPFLSRAGSPAMRAVDAAARTAAEPDVVRSLPPRGRPAQRVTRNPLHAKLPRP